MDADIKNARTKRAQDGKLEFESELNDAIFYEKLRAGKGQKRSAPATRPSGARNECERACASQRIRESQVIRPAHDRIEDHDAEEGGMDVSLPTRGTKGLHHGERASRDCR